MGDPAIETTLEHDAVTEPASLRVVESVAEAEGVSPLELDPLHTVVDPEALDWLFRPQLDRNSVADASAAVRFEYHGYSVRVTATGLVTLDGRAADSEATAGATAD